MSSNTYCVEYSKSGRAKCKLTVCNQIIQQGQLRIGKKFPNPFGDNEQCHWFHPPCVFQALARARSGTKKISSTSDIEDFDKLPDNDKQLIEDLVKDYLSGKMKAAPIKRKAAGESKKKPPQKKRKKANSSSEENPEDDSDGDFSDKKTSLSEEDSDPLPEPEEEELEEEPPKKKVPLKKGGSNLKSGNSAPVPAPKKKDKAVEEEEVDGYDEDIGPGSDALKGVVIASCGKLSLRREQIEKLVEKNGGAYSKSITKAVTHVVCANKDAKTLKLTKAKAEGKSIVGEEFLKRFL